MDEGPGFLELALTYTQFRACDTAEQSMRGNLLQNMPEKAMWQKHTWSPVMWGFYF